MIAEARAKSAEATRVSMEKIGAFLTVADDTAADPTERVLAVCKALMVQVAANAKQGSFGDTINGLIEKVGPRLETFGGNMQEMAGEVHELLGRVERIETNFAALMKAYGQEYRLEP